MQVSLFSTPDGLFDPWIESQLPQPIWTALILPDCDAPPPNPDDSHAPQTPSSSAHTPISSPQENIFPQSDDDDDDSQPPGLVQAPPPPSLPLPLFPGCRGGHQMVIDSANQVLNS